MNAPTHRPLGGLASATAATDDDGIVVGVARHVSADGCQVLLTAGTAVAGRRMLLMMAADRCVGGAIRWVLPDRIGFAFDAAIDPDTIAELAGQGLQPRAVQLVPVARPACE